MSYILDALKKAELARNRGRVPQLFSEQAAQVLLALVDDRALDHAVLR